MAQDLARFAEAVEGYRSAANNVIKRAYVEKMRGIRAKYEPLISANEKDEKDRRLDAIAMLEAFLRKYPHDKRWTPDAMFRLAELYYEKSFGRVPDRAGDLPEGTGLADAADHPGAQGRLHQYRRALQAAADRVPELPVAGRRLLPAGLLPGRDGAGGRGQAGAAGADLRQPLQAARPAGRRRREPHRLHPRAADRHLQGLRADPQGFEVRPRGLDPRRRNALRRRRVAAGHLGLQRVLDYKDSSYYDKALYKLAWSYYRDNRFPEAIREFDNLVKYADEKKAAGDKFGSDLRPEAIQYLGVSFSEPDWDGDTVPDAESGLQRIEDFYKGRENEPHVKEVYQRLGDIYFDQTKYTEAVAIYKALLEKWPYFADAPKIQDKIVRAYERDRNMVQAAKERELLGRNYSKGSDWYNANRDNAEALAVGQQLAEDALLDGSHQRARRGAGLPAGGAESKRTPGWTSARRSTAPPASSTRSTWPPIPTRSGPTSSRRTGPTRCTTAASCREAIAAYTVGARLEPRQPPPGRGGLPVVKVLRGDDRQDEGEPPDGGSARSPTRRTPSRRSPRLAMPEVYRSTSRRSTGTSTTSRTRRRRTCATPPRSRCCSYRDWPQARGRLGQVTEAYCGTKPEVGFKAYDALLATYFIDFNVEDEEQKDCALGRAAQVAEQFGESACGKSPKAAEYIARIIQIKPR